VSDSLDTLGQAVGLRRETMLQLLSQVRENQARLESCSGHEFEDITPQKTLGKRYRCKNCHGDVDAHAHHWYCLGLEHARKS
jgi:lipopolysaccharide biosynthesis regulator YciM